MAKMTKSELRNFFNGYISHLARDGVGIVAFFCAGRVIAGDNAESGNEREGEAHF